MKKTDVYIWCLGAFLCTYTFQSCSGDDLNPAANQVNDEITITGILLEKNKYSSKPFPSDFTIQEVFFDGETFSEACAVTDFTKVLSNHFLSLINDPYFDFELINYYSELNRKYVTFYRGENYYGQAGEYNQLAKKRIRELTGFWQLNREIYLNGQHTASLDTRETLTDMIESFDRTVRNRDQAYEKADALIKINSVSPNIPENPYFALDAFTRSNGLLVIGDGLLETLAEVGIDGDIAFTGILSHEWWHQAQFEYSNTWDLEWESTGERSRFIELEADFAAAYFMAHKRGATYNWKRIEDYFRLSFNVGDCLTNSDQHHGTPRQRLDAARLGYSLVQDAQKKGAILTPDSVHSYFNENYETMVL